MSIQAAPLSEIAAQLRSGTRDLRDYVDSALDRLKSIEPKMQAFLPESGRRDRLRWEVNALKAHYPDPAARPPLYGVLLGVKDVFRADGFETRAGSTLSPLLFAGSEAPVVTRLKQLGALILGKTVTAEFAYIEPGATRNPHNLAHTPGGSSSGSAAAVAAGVCALAIGTQTIGSVIRPASFCGIVGFKPSYGRISTDGVVPVSRSLDHVGLFTQDLAGMAFVAPLLCQEWKPIDEADRGRRPTFGVIDGAYLAQASPEMIAAFERRIAQVEKAGFVVKRVNMLEDIEAVNDYAQRLMAFEAAKVHAAWYEAFSEQYRPRSVDLIQRGQSVSDETAAQMRLMQIEVRSRLENHMGEAAIDLWLSPAATGTAPHGLESTGNSVMNLPWSFTGLPALTLPMGTGSDRLPLGIQITGAYGSDERLIEWAAALNRA